MSTSSRRWYRSLYWRAAAGLILLVSGLFAAEAGMRPTLFVDHRTAAIAIVIALLICGPVLTGFWLFGPTTRRLSRLAAVARRLGSGDLSARAPESGSDEVSDVAAAFNAMAAALARHEHDRETADRE